MAGARHCSRGFGFRFIVMAAVLKTTMPRAAPSSIWRPCAFRSQAARAAELWQSRGVGLRRIPATAGNFRARVSAQRSGGTSARDVGHALRFLARSRRRSVMKMMHRLWPEQQAGLMDAMLIGERAFVERPMSVDFQRSGTYHILVVSGMNVGILAFVIFWTLRRLRSGETFASIAPLCFRSVTRTLR